MTRGGCTFKDYCKLLCYWCASYNSSSYAQHGGQEPQFCAVLDYKHAFRLCYSMLNSGQAGGFAGTSVDLLFFPIDTIKARRQSSQGFLRAGGFSGMYKGVGSVMVGSAPGGSVFVNTSGICQISSPFSFAYSRSFF